MGAILVTCFSNTILLRPLTRQGSIQETILEYYGIRESTHWWIISWLSRHIRQVVLDGQASDPVPVLSSVPQVSVLGPVLFHILIRLQMREKNKSSM